MSGGLIATIIDILIVGVVALCVYNGYRKGFILGIFGILAVVVSIFGADIVADAYSPELNAVMEPFVGGIIDSQITKAEKDYDEEKTHPAESDRELEVNVAGIRRLGFSSEAAKRLVLEAKEAASELGQGLRSALVAKFCSTMSYAVVFIVAFLLIAIVFTVVSNVLNLAFKLPGLELVNYIGGGLLGLAKGALFVVVLTWAVKYSGLIISEDIVDNTHVLKWLVTKDYLSSYLSL